MKDSEREQCPKCNKKALCHRIRAGEVNWICGNGHNWTSEDSSNKRLADAQKQSKMNHPYYKP